MTEEKLRQIIREEVLKALGNDKQGLLNHDDIEKLYGYKRIAVYHHIREGVIPSKACTYIDGKRYIEQTALDNIPRYIKRKKQA